MRVTATALAAGTTAVALAATAACGSSSSPASVARPTPTVTVTSQAPTPTLTPTPTPTPAPAVTVTRTATAPAVAPTPVAPTTTVTPTAIPHLTNASAVVEQYYQDITNHDYAAAWALGGKNIAGPDYKAYVAGFSTTASISLGTVSEFGASQVQAVIYATQTDGTVKTFAGTYTVSNGVLVAASIRQTG